VIAESNQQYHANSAISHSKLEVFRRRPQLYYRRYIAKTITQEPATAALRLGSAVHCSVLEPLEMTRRFAVRPDGIDRRTKEGKERFAAFEQANAGKEILDMDEAAQVIAMTDAVRQNDLAAQLLAHGQPELSWRTGGSLTLQCRTDWFNRDGCTLTDGRPYIVDLKTTESLSGEEFGSFERTVFKYAYHRQAGFYLPLVTELLGRPVFDFFFVAVEKVEPFGVAVYRMTDAACALGQDETLEDLRRLKRCMDSNEWPNIDATVRELGVPAWYGKGGAA
jgi:exodeoxyribonuclease VIII